MSLPSWVYTAWVGVTGNVIVGVEVNDGMVGIAVGVFDSTGAQEGKRIAASRIAVDIPCFILHA